MSEGLKTNELKPATERPFPWFCPRCRRQEVWRENIAYECERAYRGQPITIVIPDFAVPKCRNCGEIVFDYLAEEQINRAYAAQTNARGNGNGASAESATAEKQKQI